jgi:hypothetical protein
VARPVTERQLGCVRLDVPRRHGGREHQERRGGEAERRAEEEGVRGYQQQQHGGEHRREHGLEVVGQARERERGGVVLLALEHVGDDGLEGGGERRRCRLHHEDEHVDLPDVGDEWQ